MAIANDNTSALARPQTLVDDWPQLAHSDDWAPGQQIGPYLLKQRLGKGGMGVVWLAEQLQPLQRDVAIKVMAGERRDAWAETWFEIERQALAQLSHRGIAQIFDAGRLPDGALFFAMEYVPGVPLDEFQQAHPLDPRALAALFVQICAAMQHAHQRGLIHRDLKPLNVLVQPLDGEPVAKIIDFGIAVRALPGVATPFRVDRVVGTPAYMSPEQKHPGAGGIDARCDIYALGVMLGEALCRAGGPPADRESIDVTAVHNAVCLELGRNTHERGMAVDALRPRLKRAPRELLAIAAKAMSADREQRYESAAAMAEDLGRWLARRPVQAVGGGRWYALRCLIRRNRIASLAAALVLAAIIGGSALAWAGMREAQRARTLAEQRRDDAEKLIQFMLGDFADKLRPIGRLDLLDSIGQEALRYLGAQDSGGDAASALSRARALRTLGEVQVTRQQFEQASATLSGGAALLDALGEPAAGAAEWWLERGTIAFWQGLVSFRRKDFSAAEQHWKAYLAHVERFSQAAPEDPRAAAERAAALSNLGTLARENGHFDEAADYFRRVIAIQRTLLKDADDPASSDLANSLAWIANVDAARGRMGEAWSSASEALELLEALGRSDSSGGRQRQREINLRFMLAGYERRLGRTERVASQLQHAFELARQDVRADPTQPRRRAMLARVAFGLVLVSESQSQTAQTAWSEGESALGQLADANLSAEEHAELNVQRCLALVHLAPDRSALERAWQDCALPTLSAETAVDSIQTLAGRFSLARVGIEAGLPFGSTDWNRLERELERQSANQPQSLMVLEMRLTLAAVRADVSETARLRRAFDDARLSALDHIGKKEKHR